MMLGVLGMTWGATVMIDQQENKGIAHILGGMSYGDLRMVLETLAVHYPARAVLIKSVITDILEDDLK